MMALGLCTIIIIIVTANRRRVRLRVSCGIRPLRVSNAHRLCGDFTRSSTPPSRDADNTLRPRSRVRGRRRSSCAHETDRKNKNGFYLLNRPDWREKRILGTHRHRYKQKWWDCWERGRKRQGIRSVPGLFIYDRPYSFRVRTERKFRVRPFGVLHTSRGNDTCFVLFERLSQTPRTGSPW